VPEELVIGSSCTSVVRFRHDSGAFTQLHVCLDVLAEECGSDQGMGIEFARLGIQDDIVDDAIVAVALGHDGVPDKVKFTNAREDVVVLHHYLRPELCQEELRPVDGWGGCCDAIVLVGVALGELVALSAALRAPIKVREPRSFAVKVVDEGLCDDSLDDNNDISLRACYAGCERLYFT
jgi:hypothetical protein